MAMQGMYGVLRVQPGSPNGAVSDEDEIRFGSVVADLAAEKGIGHFLYSSEGAISRTMEPSKVRLI
ncbi:hypothetical protein KDX38_28885 [Pseudomonas sp. CDFA 602]|nr:hypothetical protein [Pseudomonas californiensis]MCD6003156.1 hypothetical protein [Pseudomonas californiensis]